MNITVLRIIQFYYNFIHLKIKIHLTHEDIHMGRIANIDHSYSPF